MAKDTTPKRPKRKNGEGCFAKSTDGKYIEYRVTYHDEFGKSKIKTFTRKTKEECLAEYKKWKAEQEGKCPDDITGSESFAEIYEMLLKHNYKESVIRKIFYENALNFFENFDNSRIM